ncbi:MAG TPA: histidine kinase N-terminal 7TM domain-containing protein, partial [Candidatus Paceibacterota bacterium]|nr:histidine kinase N-terminal 7TM domain-containing protein [Candidatus Paceibacterota bacterium]
MNFYAISALVNFITSFTLGIFVIFKSRKSKNFSFFIFCFFVAFWSLGYYFWQISTTAAEALFWSRALMASAIFIPVAYLQFVYALVEILERKKRFIIFSYFLFFIFFLINFTPYFVSHLEPLLNFKFWPIAGPLYSLFLAVWFFYIIYSTYLLYRKYRTSSGIIRLQIRYVIMGMIIGFAGGSTNYFLWYRIPIPPVANILVSVYVGAITYAIVRYRLMDIRFVLGRGAIYFFSFVVVVSSALGLIYLNEQSGQPLSTNISGALIIIFSILLFQLSFKFFEKLASRYFFYTFYSYQTVLTELGEKLTRVLDLDKLSFLIVNTLIETMKLDRTVILLKEEGNGDYQIQKNIGFKEENGISLVKDNFLTTYLGKNQKPVVYEELSLIIKDTYQGEDKERLEELRNNMKKIEAALCLPLLMENKIIGMIVLGCKISGEPYST